MIKHLKHTEIDKAKWDSCIENSTNGLIYSLSWYLDIVSPGWDALVEDDYKFVMALPWRKKLGFSYIYTPLFVQQLGVATNKKELDVNLFLEAFPKHFKFIELSLNETCFNLNQAFDSLEKSNYVLDIKKPYEEIRKGYSRNCVRNIKKAEKAELRVSRSIQVSEFTGFVKDNLEEQLKGVNETDFEVLHKLIEEVLRRKQGEIVGLIDNQKNLHAVGFYMFSKERLIFSVCASSRFGKANQAMSKLVDSQIENYAMKFHEYDFSGSNSKGIAYFNSTFGSVKKVYSTVRINRLPRLLRLIKK